MDIKLGDEMETTSGVPCKVVGFDTHFIQEIELADGIKLLVPNYSLRPRGEYQRTMDELDSLDLPDLSDMKLGLKYDNAYDATVSSIEKWRRLVIDPNGESYTDETCSLCQTYEGRGEIGCDECPVYKAGQFCDNYGSLFADAYNEMARPDNLEMLKFLIHLRDEMLRNDNFGILE